jgi:hypothetical protein
MSDRRYATVKTLIDGGAIKHLEEIFDYIPKRVVYSDLGVNYTRFINLVKHPDLFTLRELTTMAGFFKVDPKTFINLAYDQAAAGRKGKSK